MLKGESRAALEMVVFEGGVRTFIGKKMAARKIL